MSERSINEIDAMSLDSAAQSLLACCGSQTWCCSMASQRPFGGLGNLHRVADQVFDKLTRADWLEAFSAHPKIGDLESLRMKFVGNLQWSSGEQAGVSKADEQTLARLAEGNEQYLARFGYIFIVCASGKTAAEMLSLLESRLPNAEDVELEIAAAEQRKITHLRIDKFIGSADSEPLSESALQRMSSPITTHILNTAAGRPAQGVTVVLSRWHEGELTQLGQAKTDSDGRVSAGLIDSADYGPGEYQIRFETSEYFAAQGTDTFYPRITIDFSVEADEEHYHVPLLLNPFGYTTYRGS